VNPRRQNDFLYYFEDRHGISCPIGAHIRRANPRDSIGPDPDTALRLSKMHRIIRRGRPYGERLELTEPAAQDGDGERGMFFICLNADIAGQFELIQHSWLNNPHFAGLHTGIDPFSHMEDPDNSLVIQSRPINLNIPRPHPFVKVRGGAYFFLPGIEAVQALAQ
jgi:deferrochelatase/peroxidase EfeB